MEGFVWDPATKHLTILVVTGILHQGRVNPNHQNSGLTTQVTTWVSGIDTKLSFWSQVNQQKRIERSQVLKVYVFLFHCFCIMCFFAWLKTLKNNIYDIWLPASYPKFSQVAVWTSCFSFVFPTCQRERISCIVWSCGWPIPWYIHLHLISTIKINQNVGNFSIDGWYGNGYNHPI